MGYLYPYAYASFLALTASNSSLFTPALLRTLLICFLCCPRNPQNFSQSFHLKRHTSAFISRIFVEIGML